MWFLGFFLLIQDILRKLSFSPFPEKIGARESHPGLSATRLKKIDFSSESLSKIFQVSFALVKIFKNWKKVMYDSYKKIWILLGTKFSSYLLMHEFQVVHVFFLYFFIFHYFYFEAQTPIIWDAFSISPCKIKNIA